MALKHGELHINKTGASIKTVIQNHPAWKKDIIEHFESLDLTVQEK